MSGIELKKVVKTMLWLENIESIKDAGNVDCIDISVNSSDFGIRLANGMVVQNKSVDTDLNSDFIPRFNMCLDENTEICSGSRESVTTLKELKVGDWVETYIQGFKQINGKAEATVDCVKITTSEGKTLICASDHRVLVHNTKSGSYYWTKACDIDIKNNQIVVYKK